MSSKNSRSLLATGAILGAALLAGCSSAAGGGATQAPEGEGGSAFPAGDVRFVIPYAAGGPTDVTARALAPCLGETLGTNVIAENVTGGSGAVGLQDMISKPADGQTIAIVSPGMVVLSPLANSLDYSREDITSVGVISYSPMIMITGEGSPHTTAEELFAAAESGTTINVGVSGASTPQAIELQRLSEEYGVPVTVVPFDGSAGAITALLGGHVDAIFVNDQQDVIDRIESGEFNALAVSSPERQEHIPDVPTLAELGYEDLTLAVTIYALAAPAGTPDDVVSTLSDALEGCLEDEETAAAIGENYVPAEYQDREDFDGFLTEAEEVYTRILSS